MTLHQYLIHFRSWLRQFPMFGEDEHMWVGVLGETTEQCLVCETERERTEIDTPEELVEMYHHILGDATSELQRLEGMSHE